MSKELFIKLFLSVILPVLLGSCNTKPKQRPILVEKKQCEFQHRSNYLEIYGVELKSAIAAKKLKLKKAEEIFNSAVLDVEELKKFRNELVEKSKDTSCYLPRSYAKNGFLERINLNLERHISDLGLLRNLLSVAKEINSYFLHNKFEHNVSNEINITIISRTKNHINLQVENISKNKIIELKLERCSYDESGINFFCKSNLSITDNYDNTYNSKFIDNSYDTRLYPNKSVVLTVETDGMILENKLILKFNKSFASTDQMLIFNLNPLTEGIINKLEEKERLFKEILF